MEQDARVDQGISRRHFLQLGGWLGLVLGALSFPALASGEMPHMADHPTEEDKRLAHRPRRSRGRRARRRARRGQRRRQNA